MVQVSVVIPAYNRAALLARTLESVLGQTFPDFEIIVVDDGSTEDIAAVVARFPDAPITFIRQETNQGAGAARNRGVQAARGEFIAFLDSDDEWEPEKLERQVARFAETGPKVGVVTTWIRIMPFDHPVNEHDRRGDLHDLLLTDNCVGTMSGPLVRKSLLQEIGGFDESLPSCQDWDLWLRLSTLCHYDLVPAPLTIHNRHDDTITRNPRASIAGHRLFARKYARAVRALPRAMRSEHFLTLGEAFLWKRAFTDAATCLAKAVWYDPRALAEILRFVLERLRRQKS